MGQHFLKSNPIAQRIVSHLEAKPEDTIIEIGPGKGILTRKLLATGAQVVGVEIERRLVDLLKKRLAREEPEIVHADFLEFDLTNYHNCKIIGNVPYRISTPLIEKLIQDRVYWNLAVLTFQSEFAQRLIAKPKTKAYGSLSIFFQYHLHGKVLFDIAPRFFTPPPKVRSKVIKVRPKSNKIDKEFQKFVQRVFSQRRKMLRSVLKGFDVPEKYGHKRAEELSVQEMYKLYKNCRQ